MNERIQELIEQARKKPMGDSWCYTSPKEFELKLAELVIHECMRMCDCADVSLLEHNCPKEASGAASAKQFIKEWFEVEE
jgi:hypothetical protein